LILLGRSEFLWGFAAIMTVLGVVLLRMGLAGFSREALLARDTGLRNPLGRAIAAVKAGFQGRPGLFRLIWSRKAAHLIAAAGLPAGAATGYFAASTHAIPSSVVRPVLSSLISSAGGQDRGPQ